MKTVKDEEFSSIGFLVAKEISHLVYTDKESTLFVFANVNENVKTIIEKQSQDPNFSKKPNVFGVQLDEKVRLNFPMTEKRISSF